jgi:hypothetical protein
VAASERNKAVEHLVLLMDQIEQELEAPRVKEVRSTTAHTCSPPTLDPNGVTTIIQQDGKLAVTSPAGADSMEGGMNQDGTFTVGAITTANPDPSAGQSNVQSGQVLLVMNAKFVGSRVVGTWTWHMSVTYPASAGGGRDELQQVYPITLERTQ